jgi:hypothetical protein
VSSPANIKQLVDRFARNRHDYESPAFNEANVRNEFIAPLFSALGWDMQNTAGYAEPYKDVVLESTFKVSGGTKAPDYAFRIGGARKFFVEAKKPAIRIKSDPEASYQLRRYAWSAKLQLSILTNFAEFAVYDCRFEPKATDRASVGRVLYMTAEDYLSHWDQLAEIFHKDSVLKGLFDGFADSTTAKRGTAQVDDAFLVEMQSWRTALARNVAIRNVSLTESELNFCVQQTIDRIVFLRICEDRAIEPYGQLQQLLEKSAVYDELQTLFFRADDRYNSGLFHFHEEAGRREGPDTLTPSITIDDKVLKDIIARLYYPDSPYEFSVLPAEILGHVYEQFLGQVIRLTHGHRAVVEDKPEVRRSGGVYYTPSHIAQHIVSRTLGAILSESNVRQAANVRVLDPACGSGSFLLVAYQTLLDWHLEQYNQDLERYRARLRDAAGGTQTLTTKERKRILLNSIFGVDVDPQAVEVTKLSLLLKVLEGESDATINQQLAVFRERALPDLADNIKCGNSLIGPDYTAHELLSDIAPEEVNPFDWETEFPAVSASGGFHAVIGNPPYDVVEKERGAASWPHAALLRYVRHVDEYAPALGGKLNLFRFFLVRSLNLTRPSGRYGMIMPLALLADYSVVNARRFLMQRAVDIEADCFPQKDNARRRIFRKAKLSTGIITGKRSRTTVPPSDAHINVRVYPWDSFGDTPRTVNVTLSDAEEVDPYGVPIPLTDQASWELCLRMHSLDSVIRMADSPHWRITRGEINQTVFRSYISSDASKARLVKGVEIGRYHLNKTLSQGEQEWIDDQRFLARHRPIAAVSHPRIATQRITGVDESRRLVACIVDGGYFADSTNSIELIPSDFPYRLEYLVCLLNSTLFQWRFKITSTNNNVSTHQLGALPFRQISFAIDGDRKTHDRLVTLAGRMTSLLYARSKARTSHDRTSIDRRITATDREIDALVAKLYELSASDVALVEGKVAEPGIAL